MRHEEVTLNRVKHYQREFEAKNTLTDIGGWGRNFEECPGFFWVRSGGRRTGEEYVFCWAQPLGMPLYGRVISTFIVRAIAIIS